MKILKVLILFLVPLSLFASEKSFYDFSWLDADKEVYVLQNRKFRKVGTFYVGAGIEKNANQAFTDSIGGSLLAGYFFREDWGVEFIYNKQDGDVNNTYKNFKEDTAGVPFYRQVDSYMGAMLMWSPFYSKINTFNKIFYYDWLFGVGAATITTKNNINSYKTSSETSLVSETTTGAIWTTGIRFYFTESISARLDFRALHTQTKRPEDTLSETKKEVWFHNYDFGFGLNYAF